MVRDEEKRQQVTRRMELKMYELEQGFDELGMPAPVIRTHQGFLPRVVAVLARMKLLYEIHDVRSDNLPEPRLHLMHGFRFNQQKLLEDALKLKQSGLIGAPTRFGKCFGKGTPVLMSDWTIKPVEDVQTGDYVMGPDSKPRRVAGVTQGYSELFTVTPNYNGMPWVCNEEHLLHVQRVRESRNTPGFVGEVENVSVRDWMTSTKWFKHIRKQRRVALEHSEVDLEVPPYIYGVWLGDGHTGNVTFTNMEKEVWSAIESWSEDAGLVESLNTQKAGQAQTRHWVKNRGTGRTKRGGSPLRQFFVARPKAEGIDRQYIKASRQQRLELLAGLLDTDGESSADSNCGIVTKHKQLADDIVFLCQSLGLGASAQPTYKKAQTGPTRLYWRVGIRGPVDQIPFRVPRKIRKRSNKFNCLTVGFEVTPAGAGQYFGFALEDPEGLFLLGDCTIVHNTTLIINTIRAFPGVKMILVAPGADLLLRNLKPDLQAALPHLDIKVLCSGSRDKHQSDELTLVSMDSMHKCDTVGTRLILIDEPHALATEQRVEDFVQFEHARKIGFGATLDGRFDGRDPLITGVIGPVLSTISYREAVQLGAIAPIAVMMIRYSHESFWARDRAQAYKKLLWENPRITQILDVIGDSRYRVTLPDWQILGFINNEKQLMFLQENMKTPFDFAMAKLMSNEERNQAMAKLKSGETKLCFATNMYAQGVTFSDLQVVINLAGGGASTQTIQKPGRVAEIRPNKRCGVLVDFEFLPQNNPGKSIDIKVDRAMCWQPARESAARLAYYHKIGFEVYPIHNSAQLQKTFQERCWPVT